MKFFKLMMIALVAMIGLSSCSESSSSDSTCNHDLTCDHNFIEVDYSKDLVGTWTCMDMDYAEAMVIKADGSVEVTGVVDHEYFESKGTIKVVNNKMTYKLDNGDEFEGRFEMTKGESFTMVWDDELDIRYTYRYCENDLADEVVGMWVCNDGPSAGKDMAIITYSENGKMTMTAESTSFVSKDLVNVESDYVVVGDLIFKLLPKGNVGEGLPKYIASRVIYTPNGTSLGDILTETSYLVNTDFEVIETTSTFVRVKQELNLTGKTYDYHNIYVSNVKGEDKDIEFFNTTINFAKLNASALDKFLNATIFSIMFPDANTIKYSFLEDQHTTLDAPIVVEGNKMTIKMSTKKSAYKDVVVYAFQDADNTQMHIYIPTASFEAFFANGQIQQLEENGLLDINNTEAAVKAVFDSIEAAVESINVSFVLKARE